jgi:hypothetical protein
MKWFLIVPGILVCLVLIIVNVRSAVEWVELNNRGDSLPLKIITRDAGLRLVTQIEGQNLPFGGGWEFRLKNNGDSTSVTITENGEVYNPLFRFVSKFIMGHNATLKKYAGFLEQSFRR